MKRLAEQTGNLVQQTAMNPDKLIFRRLAELRDFQFGKSGRNDVNVVIAARRCRHADVTIDGYGENQSFIVIGVIAQQLESARGLHDVRWRAAELLFEKFGEVSPSGLSQGRHRR